MSLRNCIKFYRNAFGYTQSVLAEYVGISVNALSDLELNKYQPRISTALRLAEVFQISVEDLFYSGD